jgi:hypothetical protein
MRALLYSTVAFVSLRVMSYGETVLFYVLHCKGTILKFKTNIPRKGIARPHPHSCVCERFIYSHDRSAA